MVSTNTRLRLEIKNHNESVRQNVDFVSIISNTNVQITNYKMKFKKNKKVWIKINGMDGIDDMRVEGTIKVTHEASDLCDMTNKNNENSVWFQFQPQSPGHVGGNCPPALKNQQSL